MFTTGNNIYLYITIAIYAVSFFLFFKNNKAAYYVMINGFALHTLFIAGRGWAGGVFLPNPLTEGPYILPWCIALLYIYKGRDSEDKNRVYMLLLALAFSVFSVFYADGIIPPTPNKVTLWASAFFLTENLAHASFYCGALYAALSFFKDDISFHEFVVWGFVFYSIAQVTGAIWCYNGWGNTFRWSERHLISAAMWLYFAAYIHLRYLPKWSNRKKAVFAIIGALFVFAASFAGYIAEAEYQRIGG